MAKLELVDDAFLRRQGDDDYNGGGGNRGGGSEPPMELVERVAKLEALAEKTSGLLVTIERDLAVIKSSYSTKADVVETRADLHKELNAQTWKLISFCAVLVGAVYFIATHFHP